jgi:hypothetical protein
MKTPLATAALLCLTLPAFGQGVDPYIGTWKFNVEKSTWIGTPAPKGQALTYCRERSAISLRSGT